METQRRITLAILFSIFEGLVILVGRLRPVMLTPFLWVLLALAASLGGAGVAYLAIGEWIRWPLVKVVQHSSGTGEDTEPKYEGWRQAPGILLSCPICAGAWVAMGLFAIYSFFHQIGLDMIYVMSAGGSVRLIVRLAELLEWQKHLAWEETGYWNRLNKREQWGELLPPEIIERLGGHDGHNHNRDGASNQAEVPAYRVGQ